MKLPYRRLRHHCPPPKAENSSRSAPQHLLVFPGLFSGPLSPVKELPRNGCWVSQQVRRAMSIELENGTGREASYVTSPFSMAKVVRVAVLWTLSFCIRFDRCFSTVLTLM